MTDAFSADDCEVFSRALAQAWDHLLETGQNGDEAVDKAALSQAVLKAGDLGERSEPVLVAYALAHLQENKLEIQRRINGSGTLQ
jgi:hypothetical protein